MVRNLTATVHFSRAAVEQRLAALIDPGTQQSSKLCEELLLVEGSIGTRRVRIALTDRNKAAGSLGVKQCQALADACARSAADRMALVFVLDSAGARLDEGLAALGAFRRLYRAALSARLTGVPMIALVAKNCFGGASMLAALCTARAVSAESRYGMSGPAIVEGLGGRHEFDASDAAEVRALYGGQARAALGAVERLCEDDADGFRGALEVLAAQATTPPDIDAAHRRLKARLCAAGLDVSHRVADADRAFRSRRPVGALDCWQLADWLLESPGKHPLAIELDCPGQSPTRQDEALLISDFVAHLALCIASVCASGRDLKLRITGEAGGGIYVALAAATQVEAVSGATVRVLPQRAVKQVMRNPLPEAGLDEALAAGVVDVVLSS